MKYTSSVIQGSGIGISLLEIDTIHDYKINDGYLMADVNFKFICFNFFKNEVIEAKIYKQDEDGLRLALPFFNQIIVQRRDLPEESEKAYAVSKACNKKGIIWYWNYEGNKLYYMMNEPVRFKVSRFCWETKTLYGKMNENGLGQISWWT